MGLRGTGETIAALSTAPGRAAIAVVRVSGPDALRSARDLLPADLAPVARRATAVRLRARDGSRLDEAVVVFFPGPASYTGEDVLELSCHGSLAVAGEVLEGLLAGGARLARPGEFTERAFLNGKLDLAQAEAVRDLIESRTVFQARVAAEQLGGGLSRELLPVKDAVVRAVAHLETAVEFVEDQVDPESMEALLAPLAEEADRLARLEGSFRTGSLIREGVEIAVTGKPNAGKSSLFNALLGRNRAIVTEVAGTTRDALSEAVDLRGVPARLVDTAGIRESRDLVERLGVEKSKEFVRSADVALFVADGSREWDGEDRLAWELASGSRAVVAVNKCDLPRRLTLGARIGETPAIEVSAVAGTGLERLRDALWEAACGGRAPAEAEGTMLTNLRHKECVRRARENLLEAVQAGRSGLSEEFCVHHLRGCLAALGEITGETAPEEILRQIFSSFCIGK